MSKKKKGTSSTDRIPEDQRGVLAVQVLPSNLLAVGTGARGAPLMGDWGVSGLQMELTGYMGQHKVTVNTCQLVCNFQGMQVIL